jgi:hypothetical protein
MERDRNIRTRNGVGWNVVMRARYELVHHLQSLFFVLLLNYAADPYNLYKSNNNNKTTTTKKKTKATASSNKVIKEEEEEVGGN